MKIVLFTAPLVQWLAYIFPVDVIRVRVPGGAPLKLFFFDFRHCNSINLLFFHKYLSTELRSIRTLTPCFGHFLCVCTHFLVQV